MTSRYLDLRAQVNTARTDFLNGKEHLIIPVVALVEGVRHAANSPGPELALAEEFGKRPEGWNGRPVVFNHPKRRGQFVSANSPDVWEHDVIGQIFNTKLDGKKLITEAWIDIERVAELDDEKLTEAFNKLQDGETLEVSIGAYADVLPEEGEYSGARYSGRWSGVVPDHLAILTDGVGACSVEDGCGTNRVAAAGGQCSCGKCVPALSVPTLNAVRRPHFSGTENTDWQNVNVTLKSFISGYFKHSGKERPADFSENVADMPAEAKRWIASRTLLGNAEADSVDDLLVFPVVNPSTDRLNACALRATLGEQQTHAVPSTVLDAVKSAARSLLEQECGEEQKSSGFAKLLQKFMNVFEFRAGRAVSDVDLRTSLMAALEPEMSEDDWFFIVAVFDDFVVYEKGWTLYSRDYTQGEDGRVTLGEKVIKVRPVTEFVPVEPEGAKAMAAKEKVEALIANEASPFTKDDAEQLSSFSDERIDELNAKFKPAAADDGGDGEAPKVPPANQPDPVLEDEDKKVVSMEAYIKGLPPEVAATVTRGVKMLEARKTELITALTGSKKCKFSEEQLKAKDVEELEMLVELAQVSDFTGRGGPRVHAASEDTVYAPDPEPLWGDPAKKKEA